MKFFTDKSAYDRRGSFCGIPVFYSHIDDDGLDIAGTNAAFDWLVGWWPQLLMVICRFLGPLVMTPEQFADYEPAWQVRDKGPIAR